VVAPSGTRNNLFVQHVSRFSCDGESTQVITCSVT
jgi:hypothetical protein